MAKKAAWGLDVGQSALKTVRIERGKSGLQLTDCRIIPLSGSEEDRDAQIRDAVTEFLAGVKLKGETIAVSLPGHKTFARFIKLPPVEEKRLPEIVKYEATQQIPFPLDDVIWDWAPIEKDYDIADEKEVGLFAIKKDIVTGFVNNLQLAGLEVGEITIAPMALYNFVQADRSPDEAMVLLDVGESNTDLVVIDGPNVWIRNIAVASGNIDTLLAKRFKLGEEEAEKLKKTLARNKQAGKIFSEIKASLKQLVGVIQQSLGFYKSLSGEVRFEKALMVGNGSKLAGLQKFLSQNMQMPVEKLDGLDGVQITATDTDEIDANLPGLACAIGLGVQGVGAGKMNISLVPEHIKEARLKKQKQPWGIAAVACLALAVGALWMGANAEVQHAASMLEDEVFVSSGKPAAELADGSDQPQIINDTKQAGEEFNNTWNPLRNRSLPEANRLGAIGKGRREIGDVLTHITGLLPDNAAVPAVDQLYLIQTDLHTLKVYPGAEPPASGHGDLFLHVTVVGGVENVERNLGQTLERIKKIFADPMDEVLEPEPYSGEITLNVEEAGELVNIFRTTGGRLPFGAEGDRYIIFELKGSVHLRDAWSSEGQSRQPRFAKDD